MKIALACNSLLLTKSLEIFLKKNITSYKRCDFVISDKDIEINKPLFKISGKASNLQIPFSESSLRIELDKFHNNLTVQNRPKERNMDEIKRKIDFLTKKFRDDLIKVVDEYHEKR